MCVHNFKLISNPHEIINSTHALKAKHVCNHSQDWSQCFETGLNFFLHKRQIQQVITAQFLYDISEAPASKPYDLMCVWAPGNIFFPFLKNFNLFNL